MHAPAAAASVPARPVLPAAELRNAGGAARRHTSGDGRPGPHRRLGRPRAGPRFHHRAGNGRLVRPVHAVAAGRTGRADGADRHADGNRAWRNGGAAPAVASATPCCSRSGTRFAAPGRRCCTSPATRRCMDRYKVAEIEAAADVVVWCSDEAPGFVPQRAAATARSSATSCRRCARTRQANWAARRSRSRACDRIIAIGSGQDDGGRRGRAAHRRWRRTSSPTIGPSARSTRRCNA